jgi:hypothetical protein
MTSPEQLRLRQAITHFDPEQDREDDVVVLIDDLVKSGADPREFNDFPLRLAARAGLLSVVKYLIKKYKADDAAYDFEALVDAADRGHVEMTRFLAKRMQAKLRSAATTSTHPGGKGP